MSEYWKSSPKYWCKNCNIYVKDTPLERKQHENTGKHQGNLKRFLQTIQINHAKSEREKDKAKLEVERLNRVVGSKASPTVLSSISRLSSSKLPSSSTSLSAADQKRQWAQLAEMGISIPESARAEMAMVGDWQTTSRRSDLDSEIVAVQDDKVNIGVKKRKLDDDDEEEEVEDSGNSTLRKGWGSATKSYPGQPLEDLGALLAIPISKRDKATENFTPKIQRSEEVSESRKLESDIVKSEDNVSEKTSNIIDGQHGQEDEITAQQHNLTIKLEASVGDMELARTESDAKVAVPLFKKRKSQIIHPPGNT